MDWMKQHLRRDGAALLDEMIDDALGTVKADSPIERLFGAAALVLMRTRYPLFNYLEDGYLGLDDVRITAKSWFWAWADDPELACFGVVAPQVKIGKYRADFVIVHRLGIRDFATVVVECDGHEFHEKTAEQAERDRRRDRDMQMLGCRVFRFTGREIKRNPFAAARSVLEPLNNIAITSHHASILHKNGCSDLATDYMRKIGVCVFDGGPA